jgi:hypothetical protein
MARRLTKRAAGIRAVTQACADCGGYLLAGGLKRFGRCGNSLSVEATGNGFLQLFSRLREAPCADPARRPFERMGRGGRYPGLGAVDAFEHDADLADEYFENFPLKADIAQGHAPEVLLVDDS